MPSENNYLRGIRAGFIFDPRLQDPNVLSAYVRTLATMELAQTWPVVEMSIQTLTSCMGKGRGDYALILAKEMAELGLFKLKEISGGVKLTVANEG